MKKPTFMHQYHLNDHYKINKYRFLIILKKPIYLQNKFQSEINNSNVFYKKNYQREREIHLRKLDHIYKEHSPYSNNLSLTKPEKREKSPEQSRLSKTSKCEKNSAKIKL